MTFKNILFVHQMVLSSDLRISVTFLKSRQIQLIRFFIYYYNYLSLEVAQIEYFNTNNNNRHLKNKKKMNKMNLSAL